MSGRSDRRNDGDMTSLPVAIPGVARLMQGFWGRNELEKPLVDRADSTTVACACRLAVDL
jgi:hypothetical protein